MVLNGFKPGEFKRNGLNHLNGINRMRYKSQAFKWIGFKHSGFKSALGVRTISFKWMGFKLGWYKRIHFKTFSQCKSS